MTDVERLELYIQLCDTMSVDEAFDRAYSTLL